ncbi:hypothetical protein AbraIFM66950_001801 [Aspergillus brasiliensis]|nr:hypothetical protein AbraIFM66950_001801 [Aspergillus brasiliensis]
MIFITPQAEDYPSTCLNACDNVTPDPDDANFYCDYCICNNRLLGWSDFHAAGNFTDMFEDWIPLGGYCPQDWLCTWANWTDNGFDPQNSHLVYPPNNGFQGCPQNVTLQVGTLVDRFGREDGSYLAPAFTPYEQRSIGPSSLNKFPNSTMYNYWLFNVTEEFTALGGEILPWYGQPGGGYQWYVSNIDQLLADGTLELVVPSSFGFNEAWEAAQPLE